ncbi:bromodomain adjacent to zinc finger domain protein 1A-like [Saccoglossus kowalevskii]
MGRTYNAVTAAASVAAVWPQLHQGVPLRQLTLDPYTVSEVLRLHFLSSGAKTNSADAKYRYQQRGGYTPLDDAGLEFRMTESGILRTLSTGNLFDLSPGEKLKILSALCGHLMTFVTCRDYIEDSFEKWRTTRKEWRENQTAEQRRGKEEASARYKQRQEERAKEKERVKERKLKKQMLKEEMLRKDEQGKGQTNDKNNENGKLGKEKMEADEDDKPKRRLTRGMEKEEELEEKMEVDDNDGAGLAPEEEKERQKKLLEEEVKKRKEFHKKDRELFEQLQDMICKYNLTPLGQDRIYRRFWKFQSIPGLFVECDREYLDEDVLHPVEQTFKSNPFTPYSSSQESKEQVGEASSADKGEDCDTSTASNKENEENNLEMREENGESRDGKTILNESGSQNGSVKLNAVEAPKLENFDPCMLNFSHSQWSFYANTDDVDRLINTLNPRGYREGALKEALLLHKKSIMEGVQKCPIEKLRIPKTDHEAPSAVAAASTDVKPAKPKQVIVKLSGKKTGLVSEGHEDSSAGSETLELSLREQLLDLEERIYTGSLGCLKIEDRNAWIKAIENGSYDMQCRELTWGPWWARHKMDDKDTGAESMELGINEVSVGEHSLPQKQKDRVSELKRSETPTGSTRCSTPSTVDHVVKDLSCALLQIAQGIEPKYLKPPLGEDEATKKSKQKEAQEKAMKEFQAMVAQSKKGKKKDKKKQEQAEAEKGNENSDEESSSSDEESEPSKPEKTITERWQESLMSSSSIPQLFLHMATLDSSVMWSKSILHARCRICRRKGDAERMLLCDGCDRGHHMYCLKPPVKSIPSGDWYCVDCRPKIVKQNSRRRRKSTLEDYDSSNDEEEKEEADDDDESSRSEAESSSEDESEEEDSDDDDECNDDSDESAEASSDSDDESNNSEEDSHCDECAKCGREGQLILCETCPSAYHLKCANPPLKKIPAGKWICEVCTDKSQKKPTGIKFKGPAKSKSGKSTPSSVTGRSKKVSPEVKTGAEKRSRISARATGKEKPRSASLPRARTEGRTKRARDSGSSDSESPRRGSKRMKEGQPKKRFARKDSFSSEDSGPSSRRLPTSSSRGSEWSKQMKLCEQLINDVIRHKDAWPFLQPVSKKVPFSKEFKAGTRLKAFWEKKRKELGIDIRMKSKSMDGEKRQKRKSSVF